MRFNPLQRQTTLERDQSPAFIGTVVKWLALKFRPLPQEVKDPNFRSLLATANANTPVLTKHQVKTRILETARQALQKMKGCTASTLR